MHIIMAYKGLTGAHVNIQPRNMRACIFMPHTVCTKYSQSVTVVFYTSLPVFYSYFFFMSEAKARVRAQ